MKIRFVTEDFGNAVLPVIVITIDETVSEHEYRVVMSDVDGCGWATPDNFDVSVYGPAPVGYNEHIMDIARHHEATSQFDHSKPFEVNLKED